MRIQRLLIALTFVNFAILMILLMQTRRVEAANGLPVLRGSALEIVDDHGKVRASISIVPAGKANGVTYAETVILRLIDPNGKPSVKLTSSVTEAALGLGVADPTYALLKAEAATSVLKLTNKDGHQQLTTP